MPVNDPNNPGPLSSMGQSMFPGSTVHTAEYNVSSQYPTAALNAMTGYEPSTNPLTGEELPNFAGGGIVSLATGGEIADAYRQYLGRDPEAGAYDAWAGADMGSLIAGITGSQEYANRSSGGGGGGGSSSSGGGSSGGTDINALYQQYLGRNADASGAATYAGWNPDDIRNAILGSQEYANRTSSGGGSSGGGGGSAGGNDINSLYQQYLGRGADASGIATYAGWSPDQIKAAILGSPEYANAHPEAVKADSAQKIQELADVAFSKYRTNQNYDAELQQLDALAATNPAAYYKAKIGWVGNQMGWQAGQGTSSATMPGMTAELKTYLAGAKAAGVTDAEINSIVNTNSALQQKVNAERIASDAKGAHGWIDQNLGQGVTSGLTTAAALLASYFVPGGGALVGIGKNLLNSTEDNYTKPNGIGTLNYKSPTTGTSSTSTASRTPTTVTRTPTYSTTSSTPSYSNPGDPTSVTGTGTTTGTGTGTTTGTGINSLSTSNPINANGDPVVQEVPLFKATPSGLAGSASVAQNVTQNANPTQTSIDELARKVQEQQQITAQLQPEYNPDYYDMAQGGLTSLRSGGMGASLGGYSDGGQLLKGPGDGMSDNIPATIGNKQPARLADGEFVIPADVVSHLGNGSTDAGAKHLYSMMEKIRKARTGNPKQGKQINVNKFLPRG